MKTNWRKWTVAGVICVLGICLWGISASVYGEEAPTMQPTQELELPTVGSLENLKTLLTECGYDDSIDYSGGGRPVLYRDGGAVMMKESVMAVNDFAVAEEAAEAPMAAPTAAAGETGYSETNVQVQGVDEADLVKTDGKYIYTVNEDSVEIIQAVPADQMKKVAEIQFEADNFSPQEIYIDTDRLVLIGSYWEENKEKVPYYTWWGRYGTRILLYDTSDLKNLRLMRQEDLPGEKISTRKVGDYLYFAISQNLDFAAVKNEKNYLPYYTEQTPYSVGEKTSKKEIRLENVSYFPDCIQPQYLLVGGLQLKDLKQPASVQAYLADGNALYANQEHMYVALQTWGTAQRAVPANGLEPVESITDEPSEKTHIYRFAFRKMKLVCDGECVAPGRILNQFAMDEYNGNFRIATTTGYTWATGKDASRNNLYIFDPDLKELSSITDIAPGESIYSVRFMGDKAYMVTFRTVDPFFVLDLSQPAAPKIAGQLKIPGYSDYLHPYDETHIIGFGKETITLKDDAYYLGMKVALFDVSDISKPIEIGKVTIGDRGTESELLNDHKALLFDKTKNLLAFPVTVMSLNGKPVVRTEYGYSYPEYGDFSYQGAYIYRLDAKKGFDFKGKITHLSDEAYEKAGSYWYGSEKNVVRRILLIGDQLYTVSDGMIKANRVDTLAQTGSLEL